MSASPEVLTHFYFVYDLGHKKSLQFIFVPLIIVLVI